MREERIVVVGAQALRADAAVLREVRGSLLGRPDGRFVIIAMLSIVFHISAVVFLKKVRLRQVEPLTLEQIPERFARLIVEKPLQKPKEQVRTAENSPSGEGPASEAAPQAGTSAGKPAEDQRIARQRVANQVMRVEQKIRTVGVLGMLTGAGSTAKGPAVVDVLGKAGASSSSFNDLEGTLKNMSGLRRVDNAEVLNRKLVASKDVALNYKEDISQLVAGLGAAKTTDLRKKGDIVIQKPESIEGAASSSAKRDQAAINAIVSANKISIRMSYEKWLSRDPALAGKITVRFTIEAMGTVKNVEILENTTGNTELEQEIIRKVKTWRFEPIPEGEVTVTYPLVFRAAS